MLRPPMLCALMLRLRSAWQKGLDTGEGMYKICGAGGGGYFIRF